MKRTIAAFASVAWLAMGALTASTTQAAAVSAQDNAPVCTKLPIPAPVYGTWYKCTDSTNNTTRYTGQLSASHGAAVVSFPGWGLQYDICLDTKIDTGYRAGSSVVSINSAASSLCR